MGISRPVKDTGGRGGPRSRDRAVAVPRISAVRCRRLTLFYSLFSDHDIGLVY